MKIFLRNNLVFIYNNCRILLYKGITMEILDLFYVVGLIALAGVSFVVYKEKKRVN